MATKPTNSKTGSKGTAGGARPVTKPKLVASTDSVSVNVEQAEAGSRTPGVALKLKALIEQVTVASGVKKKDVRSVIDAVLDQLGGALKRGESMSLPGLGHVRVVRKATEESPVMTLKLRQVDPTKVKAGKKSDAAGAEGDTEALAEDSEEV